MQRCAVNSYNMLTRLVHRRQAHLSHSVERMLSRAATRNNGSLDFIFESCTIMRCAPRCGPLTPDFFRLLPRVTEHMNFGGRSGLVWPYILAAVFFLLPVTLLFAYPVGFWSSTDNEPLGLANALNAAYRLADFRMYQSAGLADHPGIQYYFMSWLALAFTGYPVEGAGPDFFRNVIDNVDGYHRASICIAALVGATGVFVFARTALKLIPVAPTVVGLLLWLVSTPATLLYFMSPGFESVALLINSLFLAILVRLAFDREINVTVIVIAGCVGAFAYLNKLSYIYIPLALVSAIFWKAVFCRAGWFRGVAVIALSIFTFVAAIAATGYLIIGWHAFRDLLRFHQNVILGTGLYGTGDQVVVDQDEVRRAIMAIPGDMTYAVPLALITGGVLFVVGLVTGITNRQKDDIAVMAIGVGLAASFSALIVLKHYASHYTAGVSATLPACAVACGLLAQAWDFKLRISAVAVAWVVVLLMARPVLPDVIGVLDNRSTSTRLALADKREIEAQIAGMKRVVDFAYRVPFPQYGEGFVIHYAGVPRLTQAYLENKGRITNSVTEQSLTEDVGAYVIDKGYFPNVEAVKRAANVDLVGPKPVRFEEGDKLIELRTVFLLIRK